jgi:hypothetical protein
LCAYSCACALGAVAAAFVAACACALGAYSCACALGAIAAAFVAACACALCAYSCACALGAIAAAFVAACACALCAYSCACALGAVAAAFVAACACAFGPITGTGSLGTVCTALVPHETGLNQLRSWFRSLGRLHIGQGLINGGCTRLSCWFLGSGCVGASGLYTPRLAPIDWICRSSRAGYLSSGIDLCSVGHGWSLATNSQTTFVATCSCTLGAVSCAGAFVAVAFTALTIPTVSATS